ncbi:TIR-like protein FxsC [Streptomyces sp. NPDC001401]|uniref:TIR-like protein FxsC n=1 Tax=Streptomyces sp. NPDC001401 TaxID=3364570 RepID=UPI00369A4DAC
MSQEPDRADRQAPYFFLSYAHTPWHDSSADPDHWVHQLFRDLCDHIMALTDHPAGQPIGFMAREMRIGERWSDRLSEALATCQVFVPLYSPRYFVSDVCGKEWWAFSQRQEQHRLSRGAAGPAIVPALWVPVQPERLPGAAEVLSHDHERFGRDYAAEGLYALMKLRIFREEYERAVYLLAKAIVVTAQQNPIPTGQPLDFTDLPSAFGRRSGSRRLRIVVAAPNRQELPPGRSSDCYGPSAVDWNPYRVSDTDASRPLAEFAAEEVRRLDYLTTIQSLGEASDGLLTERPPDGPTLVLLDRWALTDPGQRELLARVDQAAQPWVSVIVPWNRSDPDNTSSGHELQTVLEKTLPRTLQRGRSVSRSATGGVPSLEGFAAILPTVIQWATAQFIRYAPVHPPEGPAIARPRLRGPVLGGPVEEAADDRRA